MTSLHHVYVVTGISPSPDGPRAPYFTQQVFQLKKDADKLAADMKELCWDKVIVRFEVVR